MSYKKLHVKAKASSQKGGALIYILIAIALLAALTVTFTNSGGQSSSTQNSFKLATEINSQSRVIRSGIQDCILRYSRGDNGIVEANYIDPYPLNPTSSDAQYTSYQESDDHVEYLRCPGADYEKIFGGNMSGFLSPPPNLLEDWEYQNGVGTVLGMPYDGVYISIASDKSDPFIDDAMTKVDNLYSACEVDYTVGDGTNGCPSDTQCLRFWIIRRGGGALSDGSPNPCS